MKRLSLISLLVFLVSFAGYSQGWIEFGWHQPNCPQCSSMARSLGLNRKQTHEYENIVHKYGQRIEKEANRPYRQWDKAAKKIYNLRMDRDKKLLRLLSPRQFDTYVHLTRERPQRIHDYRDWYERPVYGSVRIYPDVRRYENSYWSHHWRPAPQKQRHYDNRPHNNKNNKNKKQNTRSDNREYERGGRR